MTDRERLMEFVRYAEERAAYEGIEAASWMRVRIGYSAQYAALYAACAWHSALKAMALREMIEAHTESAATLSFW